MSITSVAPRMLFDDNPPHSGSAPLGTWFGPCTTSGDRATLREILSADKALPLFARVVEAAVGDRG